MYPNWIPTHLHPYLDAGGILLITLLLGFVVNRLLKRFINKAATDLLNDPTEYIFFRNALRVLIYLVGFSLAFFAVPNFKTLAQSILAGAGIAAIAVGFASQAALSNIVAGIFIVLFKPFRVKDRVKIRENLTGIVENITLRHTIIRDYQQRRVIIPNSIISEEIIVNSDLVESKICEWVDISISYDSDIDLAKQIISEEISIHPHVLDNRDEEQLAAGDPKVRVRLIRLGDFSVDLRAYAWVQNNADGFELRCDSFESIKKRFDRSGIEIPFPHRSLVFKNKPGERELELS